MSSAKTDSLQLNKWVPTDYVNMSEFNDNFQKIDDAHKDVTTQLADVRPFNMDVKGGQESVFISETERVRSQFQSGLFRTIFYTDNHYGETKATNVDGRTYWRGLTLAHNPISLSENAHAIVLGGDNVTSEEGDKIVHLKRNTDFCDLFFTKANCDVFPLLGNHDDGSWAFEKYETTSVDYIVPEAWFRKSYRTYSLQYNEKRVNGSLFNYKDYPEHKIRIICLNTNDVPEMNNAQGYNKYYRLHHYGVSNEQLQWLAHDALVLPDNSWHVMVFSHIALGYNPSSAGKERVHTIPLARGVLEAFRNGTSYTGSSTEEDFIMDVSVNFTNPGNLIANISGHVHADEFRTVNNINYITSRASQRHGDSITRDMYTRTEDSFDTFEVNTTARTLNAIRYGAGSNRSFTY